MEESKNATLENKKACSKCGAELLFKPGTTSIHCNYCGNEEQIRFNENDFKELDLKPYLEEMGNLSHSEEVLMLSCNSCGANQHIQDNYKSLHCVYCTMPLIRDDATLEDWILPGAIVPFQLDVKKSHQLFSNWVKSLWFAPNKLKKAALDLENTQGVYLPYWTFDAQLYANYTGQRGDYYYVNVSYTTTENGKSVRKTRQERRTRWSNASGDVKGFVDDTLIKASFQKQNTIPQKVSNWNLTALKPFDSSFLAGFVTEKYTIPLKDGYFSATQEAEEIARTWARRDIGGDTQRISSINMSLSEETFKHILLPIYISSYKYNDKVYQFFINGQTGKFTGTRPYSYWKIIFLVVFILIVVALIAMVSN
ncbi:DNA helicase PriA [uncultured Lutibacter sp.]|uniref:DNA helicase PriA n=1 Tax=uncultured Lutibacter sp. TaxID=437739 RepID=UPI0026127022|nr:DNA helicase PriA [uncultured Lutibacter sp.]